MDIKTRWIRFWAGLMVRRLKLPRDIIRRAFRKFGPRLALSTPRGDLTFAQLEDRVRAFNGLCQQWGLRPGDRIFTLMKDEWEQIDIHLATFITGVQVTSFNEGHSLASMEKAVELLRPRFFFYDPSLLSKDSASLFSRHADLRCVPVDAAYAEQLAAAPRLDPNPPIRADDLTGIGFTSGTSGEPKCLPHSHGVVLRSLRLLIDNLPTILPGRNIYLSGIPLIGAGGGLVIPWLLTGGLLVIPSDYSTDTVLDVVEEKRVTRLFITPSQLIDILDQPVSKDARLASLKQILYGTSTMPAAKMEEALARFGPIFQQGYGMAEVLPPVSMFTMEDHMDHGQPAPRSRLGSAGRVVKGVTVQIRDENNRELPPGTPGLVWIKSPTVFSGYWDRQDLNAIALVDGFLRTGDYGWLDPDRFLHILCREQDLIYRANLPLFPREVEEPAHDHPAVKEACLVKGRAPGAAVLAVSLRRAYRERTDRDALGREILDFVRARVDPAQQPDSIRVFDELPRSYLKKVLRREVFERLSSESGRA